MKHRGPDGSGIFENGNRTVFLANNRLAITDPFYKVEGPFTAEDNIHTICYNGEIYDYQKHLRIFLNKGIKLKSRTDTEVLLKGLIHKGLDFLRTVDGCWAFALYNKEKNNVIISRDLLGENIYSIIKITKSLFSLLKHPLWYL